MSSPVFILAAIALILAVFSYWHGPTLGVAVILLAVALIVQTYGKG